MAGLVLWVTGAWETKTIDGGEEIGGIYDVYKTALVRNYFCCVYFFVLLDNNYGF